MGKPRTSLIQGKQYGELIFLGLGERPEESRGHRGYKRRVKCIHCGKVWAIYSDYDVRTNKRGCASCAAKASFLKNPRSPYSSLVTGEVYGGIIFLGLSNQKQKKEYLKIVKCNTCGKEYLCNYSAVKRNKRGCRSCASKGRPLQGRVIRRYGVALKRAFEVYQKDMDFPTVFHILIEEGVVKESSHYSDFAFGLKSAIEHVLGFVFKPRLSSPSKELISQIEGVIKDVRKKRESGPMFEETNRGTQKRTRSGVACCRVAS